MTISYDFHEDDLVAWHRYFLRSSEPARRSRSLHTALWFVVFVSFASCAVLYFQTYAAAVVGYGLAAALSVWTWRGYEMQIERALRAHAADPQLRGGFGRIHLTLSEDGLREITPVTDSLVKWDSVTEIARDADRIFVRLATGQAAVISRASYSGPIPFDDIPRVIDEFRKRRVV